MPCLLQSVCWNKFALQKMAHWHSWLWIWQKPLTPYHWMRHCRSAALRYPRRFLLNDTYILQWSQVCGARCWTYLGTKAGRFWHISRSPAPENFLAAKKERGKIKKCGEQKFFQTSSSTETMLFLGLAAVQARLYSVQYHVSKNFVEQSYRSNGPKVRDLCRLAMSCQQCEQSPSPARRDMAM